MKNAIIYSAVLPSVRDMRAHLDDRPYRELATHERIRHAFVEDETGIKVHDFPGGYALCLQSDEKILPADVVRAEVDKRVKAIEKEASRHLHKAEQQDIKARVYDEFLARALTKTRHTWAYYHEAHRLLFVDGPRGSADALLGELIQACASVKTETIHIADIKKGLTKRLFDLIQGEEEAFRGFEIGTYLALSRKLSDEPLERVVYTETAIATDEVLDQLRLGFTVEAIELGWQGVFARVTKDFHFRRIDWPDLAPLETDDPVERWQHEAAIQVAGISDFAEGLCDLMGYEPPALDEKETADAGAGA